MRRTIVSLLSAVVIAAPLAFAGAPASAAQQIWTYHSKSGGTQANLIGTTVRSDLTGASTLASSAFTGSTSNRVAKVAVPGLIKVGAITSSQEAAPFGSDGLQITSKAKIAGVNLLAGAIKIKAVETLNIARATPSGYTKEASSTLANLIINGESYPLSAEPNTTIEIPGLAEVVINEQRSNVGSVGIETKVNALRVTLLKDFNGAKLGSTIVLAPSSIQILNGSPENAIAVGGFAYGTAALVEATDAQVAVGPTGFQQLPTYGTGGKLVGNSTVDVDIPQGLIKIGAIESKVSGISAVGSSDAYAENQIARVNVLDGFVTADAIKVKSHVAKTADGHVEEQSMTFANLKVAGKSIPLTTKPNTRINVAGVAEVTINWQVSASGYSGIIGVRVLLSTKRLGLPAGADIHLGVASTFTAASSEG